MGFGMTMAGRMGVDVCLATRFTVARRGQRFASIQSAVETKSPCWRIGMDCVRFGRMKSWMLSMGIVAALVASSAAPRAFAQSKEEIDERCQRRIAHADHELHEAIEHHGRDSRQADHERHELREAREQCWHENHRWWDEHERRWHEERDWDDRDHDRD